MTTFFVPFMSMMLSTTGSSSHTVLRSAQQNMVMSPSRCSSRVDTAGGSSSLTPQPTFLRGTYRTAQRAQRGCTQGKYTWDTSIRNAKKTRGKAKVLAAQSFKPLSKGRHQTREAPPRYGVALFRLMASGSSETTIRFGNTTLRPSARDTHNEAAVGVRRQVNLQEALLETSAQQQKTAKRQHMKKNTHTHSHTHPRPHTF
jgi:hypothetical protein